MDLASWKLEEYRQNGMSCQDYAEWIKYLARLATPPNANVEEQRQLEALELRKFILTLDGQDEQVYLDGLKLTRLQDVVAVLERYH